MWIILIQEETDSDTDPCIITAIINENLQISYNVRSLEATPILNKLYKEFKDSDNDDIFFYDIVNASLGGEMPVKRKGLVFKPFKMSGD